MKHDENGSNAQRRHRSPPWAVGVHPGSRAARRAPHSLTVRLLAARARARPTKLLCLAPARVGNKQRAVIRGQDLLDLALGRLVYVFLVVGDDGLSNGLPDGVDLRRVAAALDADPNVDAGKALAAQQQDGLVHLELQHLWLDKLDRHAIDLHQTTPLFAVRDGDSRLLAPERLNRLHLVALVSHGAWGGEGARVRKRRAREKAGEERCDCVVQLCSTRSMLRERSHEPVARERSFRESPRA
mmetsp:Transcript_20441/g.60315  ORF Transcript_20441/g.60315 Transcript_20441/m.60315 type:complete len:242 (+) Transcript_20441:646-1371(+)